jgi:ferric hydroxamate transport system substrate-binding protein
MMLTLGVTPIGVVDRGGYARIVGKPALSDEVADLGGAWVPNLERIQSLRPDLILLPQWPGNFARVSTIAPTDVVKTYGDGGVLETGRRELVRLAQNLGMTSAGEQALAHLDTALNAARIRLDGKQIEPVYYLQINRDGRHVTINTPKSLPGEVLQTLGVRNAWNGPETAWGFVFAGVEGISSVPEARLIYADQGRDTRLGLQRLQNNAVWNRLEPVRSGRVTGVDAVYSYGGYSSGVRLAELIADAFGTRS